MKKIIISEQDIINTYNKRQQEQCRLYKEYLKIKKENPTFGYKRISKLLGQPSAKTRWWHASKHKPVPLQTVEWLKEKKLINLTSDHPQLKLIIKLLGALFGDGGTFDTLNAIFLSSSELEAVKEFGEDLKKVFGEGVGKNSRIIEGGEYGHSWCYQNTNRNIIRFFTAFETPIGKKSQTNLIVPKKVLEQEEQIHDEFFGSLFGGELGVPKIHISGTHLDTLALGITGKDELAENRISFLQAVAKYLNNKGIKTGKICISDQKKVEGQNEPRKRYSLLISLEFENVTNFLTLTKMHYCKYKREKLLNTMNEFSEIKRKRFNDLLLMGYSEQAASNLLRLSPASLEIIHNFEDFLEIDS